MEERGRERRREKRYRESYIYLDKGARGTDRQREGQTDRKRDRQRKRQTEG